jgi:predicted N-formylglutamate amidohydrolase
MAGDQYPTVKHPLLEGEEDPVIIVNGGGASRIFLVCEHAGRKMPRRLGNLGLPESELHRHIAYDIGAEEVARSLAQALDAPLVLQRYSRLVQDCNRPPEAASAMPEISETTVIPGNARLAAQERAARTAAIYQPFHDAVATLLDSRQATGQEPIFIAIHSFTPTYKGIARHLDIGILHDRDQRHADRLIETLTGHGDIEVRRNQPYGPEDGVTHTLNLHAGRRRLLNAMIEIRNDLIADAAGQAAWSKRLASVLGDADDGRADRGIEQY